MVNSKGKVEGKAENKPEIEDTPGLIRLKSCLRAEDRPWGDFNPRQ